MNTIDSIDEQHLNSIVDSTPGLTRYGNRARAAVMLPVKAAKIVSFLAKQKGLTVSETIVSLVNSINLVSDRSSNLAKVLPKDKVEGVSSIIELLKATIGPEYEVSIGIKKK